MRCTLYIWLLLYVGLKVESKGLLLLYRPRDVSTDCAFSHHLRYEISFGMGMSDTVTLVFRTLSETDYTCTVEVVGGEMKTPLIIVVKYPNSIADNCRVNRYAITVMKKEQPLHLCDVIGNRDIYSHFFVAVVYERLRFNFLSNSSINFDLQANMYQVTVTAAREIPATGCNKRNESLCIVDGREYCFTSGVVCDGINNCGVDDWFDEKKKDCGLPVEKLGYAPVIAVIAAMLCALLAAGHVMLRCLPPLANSFFIFNANEDNRLCIDSIYENPAGQPSAFEKAKKLSLIPVSSSSSTSSNQEMNEYTDIVQQLPNISMATEPGLSEKIPTNGNTPLPNRKTTMRSMTAKIQKKLRSVRDTIQ